MAAALDVITAATSTVLRIGIYVFLRWIPTTVVPPALFAVFAAYCGAFFLTIRSTSPVRIVSDEIDVVVKETYTQGSDSEEEEEEELLEGAEDGPLEELDVEENIVVEEKGPQIVKALLTGLPSPVSGFWSVVTFGINMALVAMAYDLIYRAPLLHASEDLSFARVGYTSSSTATLLVREPRLSELPIYLSYRYADPPLSLDSGHRPADVAWKSASIIGWLTNETDYTKAVTLENLRADTRYQYAFSNNHSGHFVTAPRSGRFSRRTDGKFTFLHSSCIKPHFPYNPFAHPLSVPGFRHLTEWIPKLQASFMLFLGDFIYADVPHRLGLDVGTYRREYRQVYASPDWAAASDGLPWLHVMDDHEIENDWQSNTTGVYQAAVDPWLHYHVAANPPPISRGATYFGFVQGPAMFFMLDTRSYRSPAATPDAAKTMLGRAQLRDLLTFLRTPARAGVRWKVVVSSVPFTLNWRFGSDDAWAGFPAERRLVLEAMWDVGREAQGVGVIVLSGDRHEFAATRFPPPSGGRWKQAADVYEFSTSPLSMFYLPYRTYEQRDGQDVCLKYIPDGNSKFGAVEITSPAASDQSVLHYRLFIDGEERWSHTITSPQGRLDAGIWS